MNKILRVLLMLGLMVLMTSVGLAQQVYSNDKVEYIFDLPSPTWKVILEPDASHPNPEFVYGDRLDGYFTVRKEVIDAGTTPSQVAQRDLDTKLRFLEGFLEGKEESFNGRLDGVTVTYEFTRNGKVMLGRAYYLQSDNRTIYALRFTGLKDKLSRIRNQTDLIARTFKLK